VEAYYQEIGRAGRDGEPSRAILMHAYADRFTHDYFFDRDYPDPADLDRIYAALRPEARGKDELRGAVRRIAADVFDKALEKLWTHGGAIVDFAENVSRGAEDWRGPYLAAAKQKRAQLDQMMRYAQTGQCRMCAVVRHFGDVQDAQQPCGVCDVCAPDACIAQQFHEATKEDELVARRVAEALRATGPRSTGKLHSELYPNGEVTRNAFEEVLGAMARAGLVMLTDAVFEKDGKEIPYCKVKLTRAGEALEPLAPMELKIKQEVAPAKGGKAAKRKSPSKRGAPKAPITQPDSGAEEVLRKWRLAEAKRRGVPAFRIFSDAVLRALAAQRPSNTGELLAITGVGASLVKKYGTEIVRLLKKEDR
ncbi:MAG: HRDC domain-containing protein, partial [Bryobacteraceae bacterium]